MPRKVPGFATPESRVGGEAAQVRFVEYAMAERIVERTVALPVERVVLDTVSEPSDIRIERAALEAFCEKVFLFHGVGAEDSRVSADVLVAADARGIPSHGVARLQRYVNGLRSGLMLPGA